MASRVLILIVFLLVGGATIVVMATQSAERAAREQARSTNEILTHLRGSLRAALDTETGQRGYLLTQDATYLAPFTQGSRTWLRELDTLDTLLGTEHTDVMATLRSLAEIKLAELERTIALASAGRVEEAVDIVRSDEGKQVMTAYRIAVAQFEETETTLLASAIRRAEQQEALAARMLAFIGSAMLAMIVMALWLEGRTARAEQAAEAAGELREAHRRLDLLARELDHRVKNLFAVVLAIVSRSATAGEDVATVLGKLRERIHALSVAHSASTGQLDRRVASLGDLVRAALLPHDPDGVRTSVSGPEVALPVDLITPTGMILHELATNATKYGALGPGGGTLEVTWRIDDANRVGLDWIETTATELPVETAPPREGFGSLMMRTSARQLGGELETERTAHGLHARLRFPNPAH